MFPRGQTILLIFLAAVCLIPATALAGKKLSQIGAGLPNVVIAGLMSRDQYVETEVRKLAHAHLVWANWALLREMGYEVSTVPTTGEAQELLNSASWVSVDRLIQPGELTAERRTMLSDYYGGTGIGYNTGSARAMSAGDIQIKGSGITSHLRQTEAKYTARATLHEAIKDAIWGEVLHRELKYGASRIVAIVDRGVKGPNGEPEVLEIRVDPVRLGHFVLRKFTSDNDDERRVQESFNILEKNLPTPSAGYPAWATRAEKILLGMKEFANRAGSQYAQMYMLRLSHGAASQSNMLLNGELIDFGTSSSQPGYEKIRFQEFAVPFGSAAGVEGVLVRGFVGYLNPPPAFEQQFERLIGSHFWRLHLADEMGQIFWSAYHEMRRSMALRIAGVPEELFDTLSERHRELADLLVQFTDTSWQTSEIVDLREISTLKDHAEGLPQKITELVTKTPGLSQPDILLKISVLSLDGSTRTRLSLLLAGLYDDLKKEEIHRGLSSEATFQHQLQQRVMFTNRPLSELYLPDLRQNTRQVFEKYLAGETSAPAEFIQNVLSDSLRTKTVTVGPLSKRSRTLMTEKMSCEEVFLASAGGS